MRTLRSKKDRELLWFAADGKCQICGEPLPDDWHADHIVPHKISKRTNVHEMQALCPRCNLKKGDRMQVNHIAKDEFRPGQRRAFDTILLRISEGKSYTAIVLPTRYGKSDVMRTSAIYLYREGLISGSLILSPNAYLRGQIFEERKFNDCLDRYKIDPSGLIIRELTEKAHLHNPNANGEMILSLTMQLANQREDTLCKWISSIVQRTGLPIVVYVDEGHMGGEDLSWGKTVQAFVRSGAKAVLLTATPIRSDGRPIPGFILHPVLVEPVKVYKRRKGIVEGKEGEYELVDIYEGIKQKISLEAHHETTFSQAWGESVICKISRKTFEVDLSKLENGAYSNPRLSELPASEVRKVLGRIVRGREVVIDATRSLVEWLKIQREVHKDCAAIVFCGNDKDPDREINYHAKMIKKYIQRFSPDLDIIIATSAKEGDDVADKLILNFVNNNKGDILIVKQMASIGLDAPRLKVALDLSPIRSAAAYVQRMMRIATPFESLMHGIYIAPEECLGAALFEQLVSNEGGEAVLLEDMILIGTQEVESKPAPATGYVIEDVQPGGASDSDRLVALAPAVEVAKKMMQKYPPLVAVTTLPELAQVMTDSFDIAIKNSGSELVNTGDLIDDLRAIINDCMGALANDRYFATHRNYDQAIFSQYIRAAWVDLYSRCQIRNTELKEISDLSLLRKLRDEAKRMQLDG